MSIDAPLTFSGIQFSHTQQMLDAMASEFLTAGGNNQTEQIADIIARITPLELAREAVGGWCLDEAQEPNTRSHMDINGYTLEQLSDAIGMAILNLDGKGELIYGSFQDADLAWQAELEAVFGVEDAAQARYDGRGRGNAQANDDGDNLSRLYRNRASIQKVWDKFNADQNEARSRAQEGEDAEKDAVLDLRRAGRYLEAGELAFSLGQPCKYGRHIGSSETREQGKAEFHLGFQLAIRGIPLSTFGRGVLTEIAQRVDAVELAVIATSLKSHGFYIGRRDDAMNSLHRGGWMVCEEYKPGVSAQRDASSGVWCVVGDDLSALLSIAADNFPDQSND